MVGIACYISQTEGYRILTSDCGLGRQWVLPPLKARFLGGQQFALFTYKCAELEALEGRENDGPTSR